MINSIELDNFQSHKKTCLDFHEGVNIVVGNSATGKTAILRGLKWAMFNRPKGDSFTSHWGGDRIVKVYTEEGTVIRRKGKTNDYGIRGSTQSTTRWLKAFGQSVPEGVTGLLNMDLVNIQYQFDKHFLLSETPGAVAQYLDRIVGLDAIDKGMSNIASKSRKTEQELSYTKKALSKEEEQLKGFSYLPEAEADINQLGEKQEIRQDTLNKHTQLTLLVDEIKTAELVVNNMPDLKKPADAIDLLLHLEEKRGDFLANRHALGGLLECAREEEKELKTIPDLAPALSMIDQLLAMEDKLEEVERQQEELDELLVTIIKEEANLERTSIALGKVEGAYQKLMPDECPLCGGRV